MKGKNEIEFNQVFKKVSANLFAQVLINVLDKFGSIGMNLSGIDTSNVSSEEKDAIVLMNDSEDSLLFAFTLAKTIVSNIDNSAEVFQDIKKDMTLKIIDDVWDIVYLAKQIIAIDVKWQKKSGSIRVENFEKIEEQARIIRTKSALFLKENNIGFELYITLNGLANDIGNFNSHKQEWYAMMLESVSQLINLYLLSVMPHIIKLKNSRVKDCEYDKLTHKTKIKYHSGYIFDNNALSNVFKDIENEKDFARRADFLTIVEQELQKARVLYINKVTSLNLSTQIKYYAIQHDLGDYPFMENGRTDISYDSLTDMNSKRKYATSKNVLIEIMDKSKNIDSVLIEDINQDEMAMNVKFINDKKGIYVMGHPYEGQQTFSSSVKHDGIETEPYINIRFVIDKNSLNGEMGIGTDDKDMTIKNLCNDLYSMNVAYSYFDKESKQCTYEHALKMYYFICCCIYILYCDINYKGVKLYSIDNSRNRSSSARKVVKDSLRVAHLRKLPAGWNVSDEAIENAKKHNIIIPTGYTFVQEHAIVSEEKKVIKVRG